jgi:hypothetical protein
MMSKFEVLNLCYTGRNVIFFNFIIVSVFYLLLRSYLLLFILRVIILRLPEITTFKIIHCSCHFGSR